MNLVISDECMACGRCAAVCPSECIFAGELHYEINAGDCAGCQTCMAVCAIDAISEI